MNERPLEAARGSGLIEPDEPLLVMLSGGGDSVGLLDVAIRLGARVSALHVNYGLREGADEDEAFVRELCARLGAALRVERVALPGSGNLQDRAREARYALAERLAEGDYAAAHTASDQAETVIYRLAVSPGSRALRGMAARRGRLVRPLLAVTREEVRDYLRARGLEWREDPSNADRRFARARVRHDVLAALRALNPGAERTIAESARQLREEGEALDALTRDAVSALGGGPAIALAELRALPPALARLVLRRLAEEAAGSGRARLPDEAAGGEAAGPLDQGPGSEPPPRALGAREAREILALGERGTKTLDLGGGLRAVVEYGTLRFTQATADLPPEPVELPVPGRARFGDFELEAVLGTPGDATVRAAALGESVTVRGWRDGDRMRPLGLGGSKSLQDLFTDRKIPRALRRTLPVVEAGGEIVWVAGVAVDERFALAEDDVEEALVGLVARAL